MGWKDLPSRTIYRLTMPETFEFSEEVEWWLYQNAGQQVVGSEIFTVAFDDVRCWQHSPASDFPDHPHIFRFTKELDRLHFKLRWF